ncbi:MAG TPA: hypothetical protein VFM99_01175 [Chitinophagales bacterium]|nr:hypothetical protein [Chitinophagales bacterium]
MNKSSKAPKNSLLYKQHKDNRYLAQMIVTEREFLVPQSMKMLAVKTGIDRSNICRYVDTLRKSKKIAVYKRFVCKITKRVVNFYTTNPDLFPQDNQIKLF